MNKKRILAPGVSMMNQKTSKAARLGVHLDSLQVIANEVDTIKVQAEDWLVVPIKNRDKSESLTLSE
jgi:hypothetical protein